MDKRILVLQRVREQLGWRLGDARMLCEDAGWDEAKALEMAPTYKQRRNEREAEEMAARSAEETKKATAFTNAATILRHAGDRYPAGVMANIREYVIPKLEEEADRSTALAESIE